MAIITVEQELPIEFVGKAEVKGFLFSQVAKNEKGYVYKVCSGTEVWYEVFHRQINQFGGVSYPKSKSFGKWAWSYFSLERALNKLESL